jgi:hypothetical protein
VQVSIGIEIATRNRILGDFREEIDHLAYLPRPASTLQQPAHSATMGGLPFREGERESGASWSISLRQSPYLSYRRCAALKIFSQ